VTIFEHFFDQHAPGWRRRFFIAPAGNKSHVKSGIITHCPDWIGIMDLDEWSPENVRQAIESSPHLKALPRFCIESYFCHPDELWSIIPEQQRAKVGNDRQILARPIYDALPDWVAHGAMWRVLRKLYHNTRLPARLESQPVTDEVEIRRTLEKWHQNLAPDRVLNQYRHELRTASNLPRDEQIKKYVHGKKFYNQVVVQTLDHLFSGKGADDWLQKFRDAQIQPPSDLCTLLDWVLMTLAP